MAEFEKIRVTPGWAAAQRSGGYRGEGLWVYARQTRVAFEQPLCAHFRAARRHACAENDAMLPGLYRDSGLSESGGCWQLFPEEGLFKVTTAQGRSWFARYGLVASWNHDSHSWLWGWAIPPDRGMPAPPLAPVARLREQGALHGWQALTEPALMVNGREGWRLAQMAARSCHMPLVYRACVNEANTHYFVIDQPCWTM